MRNFIQRVMDRQNIGVDDLNCIQRVMLKHMFFGVVPPCSVVSF